MIKKALLGLAVLLGKKVVAKIVRKIATKTSEKAPKN